MQLVELSESVCTEAATIAESFSAAYQSSFEAFVWSEGAWRAPQSFRLDPCILAHLANVAPTDPSHTKPTAEGTGFALVIVVHSPRTTFLSVGMVHGIRADLAISSGEQLAASLARGLEQEALADSLDDCSVQISRDFEELTALRKMVSCLQLSASAKQDFRSSTAAVLPILLPCLQCKEVAFVTPRDAGCDATNEGGIPQVLRHGESSLSDSALVSLVDQFGSEAHASPVVKHDLGKQLSGVLIYAISQNGTLWGYLVAINPQGTLSAPRRGHLQEFGTHESNMVVSAASILATHANNVELLAQKERMLVSVVRALVATLEAKDLYTRGHSERVALFAKRIATEMELDSQECERIYLTGLLHDIGKIAVPDATLNKKGALTEEEIAEIRRHPEAGWNILRDIEALRHVLPGVLYHHERVDGKGYPHQLTGDDIPLVGRILAVADAYDAMTSDRSYRQGLSQERAEQVLEAGRGTQWDEPVVRAAFRAMEDLTRIRETYYAKQVGILAGTEN